jgi:hypothetical protein
MKQKILLSIALLSILSADTVTLNGKVEVASIVGFDQSEIANASYQTATNTFKDITIDSSLAFNEYFEVLKNIYAKSNTSNDLEMRIQSSTNKGRLEHDNGDTITMKYTVAGTAVNIAGETWVTIPTTENILSTINDGFKAKSRYRIQPDQYAGTYSTTLQISIRAKL